MNNVNELLGRRPKYMILADLFREQIVSGKLPKNSRLLPDSELAHKYQVNARTIAASLNRLVDEGLLERAPSRGTIVIKDFSVDVVTTTNAVGMVMLSRGDIYRGISRNIAKGFRNNKLSPVLINSDIIFDDLCVVNFLQALNTESTRPYGFIIDGDMCFPFGFLKEHINDFHNVVFINKYHYNEKISGVKYATIDFREAGRIIAKYCIERGYKKIAQLGMYERSYAGPWSSMQAMINEGIVEVARQSNLDLDNEPFWKLLHGASVEDVVNDLLSSSNCPEAIFSYNDAFMRYQLLPILSHKNIELIGFYNTHHAEKCGFSSICIHEEKIAENAIKLLTNKTTEKEIFIKPELIVRNEKK